MRNSRVERQGKEGVGRRAGGRSWFAVKILLSPSSLGSAVVFDFCCARQEEEAGKTSWLTCKLGLLLFHSFPAMAPGTWTIEEEEEALFSSALRPPKSSSGPPNSRIRIFIIISDRARLLLHFPFARKQKLEWEGGGREAGAVEMSISLKDGDVPIPFFYFSLQSSFF